MSEETLFYQALEKSAAERTAFLERVCGADTALRARLEALLRAHAQPGSFLRRPALDAGGTGDSDPGQTTEPGSPSPAHPNDSGPRSLGEAPGSVLGPYRLLEVLGEGGMGTVWLAEQSQPVQRQVALKVIKPGMDSKQVIARFEAERQALALMDHPHIAKVFDAGTTANGHPYFVMELVQGVPITRYCDEHHLTPRQRLELFVPVCQAVQHAHQKGIIHRDLKPSNVLVAEYDGQPVAKVIDFGVAKATGPKLTDKTLHTEFGSVVGTLEYMSPEQTEVLHLDIDTRSDIYALGVLLYELLTGTTPLERKRLKEAALLEVLRVIREEEPPRPSTRLNSTEELPVIAARRGLEPRQLRGLVRGELDWIVMKCLEKDRNRRYETANALAMDLQRHLRDEQVLACPPSAGYRLRKFARRNKRALATVALLTAGLLVTIAVLAISNVRIEEALDERTTALNERTTALDERQRAYGKLQEEQQKTRVALNEVTKLLAALKEEQQQTGQALYFHSVALADREWWLNKVGKAETILDKCPEAQRGWEWHYLKRLCQSGSVILQRFSGRGTGTLAFSPDGKRLAACMGGGVVGKDVLQWGVRVWDTSTGRRLLHVAMPIGKVNKIAFSPDGRRLAIPTLVERGVVVVRLLNVQTGAEERTIPGHGFYLPAVAFSPSGQELAVASSDGTVKVWNPATAKPLGTLVGHKGAVLSLSYSPDGQRLATAGSDRTARVWDAASGRERFKLEGHSHSIYSVEYSPDGRRLATTSGDGLRTFEADTGKGLLTLPAELEQDAEYFSNSNAVFSPDGQRLLVAGQDRTLRVLNAATGKELVRLRGLNDRVMRVAWAHTDRLASLSSDGTIRLWPASSPEARNLTPLPGEMMSLSPDGQVVVSVHRDRGTGQTTIGVRDLRTNLEQTRVLPPQGNRNLSKVRISPDKRYVAGALQLQVKAGVRVSGSVLVWDLLTGQEIVTPWNDGAPVWALAFRPDSRRLAAVIGNQIQQWDLPRGQQVAALDLGEVRPNNLVFTPDGQALASTTYPTPQGSGGHLWDAVTGKVLRIWKWPGAIGTCQAFSPDGELLAVGFRDKKVRIWHVHRDRPAVVLEGHTDTVLAVAFSHDGRRLASGSTDKTIKIWDRQTWRELLALRGQPGEIVELVFSDDGMLTARGLRGNLSVFDGRPWRDTRAGLPGRGNISELAPRDRRAR